MVRGESGDGILKEDFEERQILVLELRKMLDQLARENESTSRNEGNRQRSQSLGSVLNDPKIFELERIIAEQQDKLHKMEDQKSRVELELDNANEEIKSLHQKYQELEWRKILREEEITRNVTNNQMEAEWTTIMKNHAELRRANSADSENHDGGSHNDNEWESHDHQTIIVGIIGLALLVMIIVLGIFGCRLKRNNKRMAVQLENARRDRTMLLENKVLPGKLGKRARLEWGMDKKVRDKFGMNEIYKVTATAGEGKSKKASTSPTKRTTSVIIEGSDETTARIDDLLDFV